MSDTTTITQTIETRRVANPHLSLGLRRHHGLRDGEFTPLCVGDYAPCSYSWDDGEPTDEELCGTCAVCLEPGCCQTTEEAIKLFARYDCGWPGQFLLLGGDGGLHGDDNGELILQRAVVLAVWEQGFNEALHGTEHI